MSLELLHVWRKFLPEYVDEPMRKSRKSYLISSDDSSECHMRAFTDLQRKSKIFLSANISDRSIDLQFFLPTSAQFGKSPHSKQVISVFVNCFVS